MTSTTAPGPERTTMNTSTLTSTLAFDVASNGPLLFLLTPCCKATGKGSGDGVVCRGCYAPVDDKFGWCGQAGHAADIAYLTSELRPIVGQFADRMAASLFDNLARTSA